MQTEEIIRWDFFTETDTPEACIGETCGHAVAVGALYIPKCGRHPSCKKHLAHWKKLFDIKIFSIDVLTIECSFHGTKSVQNYNPVLFT